jgi:hypothetical protein
MFFQRENPKPRTFEQRIEAARGAGFVSRQEGTGRVRLTRGRYSAILAAGHGGAPELEAAGRLLGDDIAELTNGGYQMFFMTAAGKRAPALAEQLVELHAFEEDLREALGLGSLYNEALGTTSSKHLYDRVEERDDNTPKEPWRSVKADSAFARD